MINYALNHGIDRYNFYGVSGKFTEDAEDAGVVKFKKVTMLKLLNMLVTLLNQLINLFTQHILKKLKTEFFRKELSKHEIYRVNCYRMTTLYKIHHWKVIISK